MTQRDEILRRMWQLRMGYPRKELADLDPEALRKWVQSLLLPVPQRVFLEKLGELSSKMFTQFVCDLLRHIGFQADNTDGPGDGGIDFRVKFSEGVVVGQCKRVKGKVGPGAVRDFYGAITKAKAGLGVLVTTGELTGGAVKFAGQVGIGLIDGWQLFDLVKEHWPERLEQAEL